MSLDPVVQPQVGCVGYPVAGNPTQFVMTRLAKSLGLDWRFFTAQVQPEKFEAAFRGLQALGFNGMALFDPFQSQAIPWLDSVTEAALCLNRVNVVRCDSQSWLGDNTLGAALSSCLLAAFDEPPDVVVILGSRSIAKCMSLAENSWLAQSQVRIVTASNPSDAVSVESDSDVVSTQFVEQSMDALQSLDTPIHALIVAESVHANWLRRIPNLAPNGRIVVTSGSSAVHRAVMDFASERHIRCIEPVDLMAHQAAADFCFWTGVHPSILPIREWLEEYLQW